MKRLLLLIPASLASLLVWTLAQPAPPPMASLFPSGALLYLEAKDFNALLADWNSSPEKKDWLASANYDEFAHSQLFLKLSDAQTQFATAAGIPPDDALLSSVAGANSAVAMYDIGKLEFLYVTRLASARAVNTALWKLRGSYQTRHAGSADYFIKEDKASHRVAAFALTGDTLLLATREDLLAGALRILAGESLPSVASEPWFRDATQAASAGPNDLRLVYNMASLARTFQFRSHWIQSNVPDLRQFSAGLADLERTRGELRERRVLLRAAPVASMEGDEALTGRLLAAIPNDSGLYRAWLHPSTDQAAQQIADKLFPNATASGPRSTNAPMVLETQNAGSDADLETRIDEKPFSDAQDPVQPLRERLSAMKLDAMLEVSSTKLDANQVYVQPHAVIVLLASTPWDANAIRAALGTAADGLGKIAVASDGKWLALGDIAELTNTVFALRNRTAVAGAAYAAGWHHARELPNFERMTRLIDFPQAQPGAGPPYFSANLASLGLTLKRIDTASVVVHDSGAMLRESLVYKITP
jgi:hypothetical protein